MIKLQIVGNLGKDCIVKEVNGKNVINFSVAHTERYKDSQGNQKERTTWVECAYWTDKTAVAQYLTKGKTVYAEGSPEADAYMNKDNQAAATLRMRVQNIQLLGGSGGDAPQNPNSGGSSSYNSGSFANAPNNPVASAAASAASDAADDLPF
jgi:single-strand DNA-binding protein